MPSLLVKPFDKFDYSTSMSVTRGDIDHCFTGWDGSARIAWQGQPLALDINASPELPNAVVWHPQRSGRVLFRTGATCQRCGEPPDRASGMPIIQPGAAFTASIRFRAVPLAV